MPKFFIHFCTQLKDVTLFPNLLLIKKVIIVNFFRIIILRIE